ncbi:conserved hypothetical protein [Ricinus communis]|uniref:Uncharacterized protein n=1 Tax=Ricinus communis TaxID=3988 RepID=B9SAK4_RICCO|nr:conserved hypothetical protein [Ricinus communis]
MSLKNGFRCFFFSCAVGALMVEVEVVLVVDLKKAVALVVDEGEPRSGNISGYSHYEKIARAT